MSCTGGQSCLTEIWHEDKTIMVRKGCSSRCINKFTSLEQCRKGKEASCELCCLNDECNTDPKEQPIDEEVNSSVSTYLDPSPPQCIDQQPIQISCVEVMHVSFRNTYTFNFTLYYNQRYVFRLLDQPTVLLSRLQSHGQQLQTTVQISV